MSRRVLVLAHTGREESLRAAWDACTQLHASGLVPVLQKSELADVERFFGALDTPIEILNDHVSLEDVELVMVLGGDGTILRAAELVREVDVPLLGVNLGHVGFLAESERADLAQTVEWIASRQYTVEERMTIDVQVWIKGQKIWHTWALNEAAIEKANRERMLEVVTEVDERPLTSFGCDGVVLATPTGSTAYAFSSGGPVVWPEVEALVIVPISAHALFAKPLVVSPRSKLAVEIMNRTDALGVLWCDGRRSVDLPPGARVEVTRSATPVRLARTHKTPFSARLVRKFELPIHGWRGPVPRSAEVHTGPIPVIRTLSPAPLPSPRDVEAIQEPGHGEPSDPTNAK
ncbi:NAD kinase [Paenarthrobacter sp. NPDC056912]|uniref:NAD kinase n=1 Tax=Paenarthrobacter sp. NPDC056912 TaxID=3345965 RepID=UPI0036721DD0